MKEIKEFKGTIGVIEAWQCGSEYKIVKLDGGDNI